MKLVLAVLSISLAACAAEKKDPPTVNVNKNRLAKAKSPYLRQHDTNPVDWYEWGDEAFEKAKREDKPIFLSIGYSTCHWCHVMARESFENPAIAKILNDHYVSIKVDREERPDIDQVYMTAAQMLTGSGGWPLSIWMTPEKKPFYAGTYFPPEDRWGRAGFPTILTKIAELWKEQRSHLLEDAEKLSAAIAGADRAPKGALDIKLLDEAIAGFKAEFDDTHGGFGGAPKFPRSIVLEFLLRMHRRTGDAEILAVVEKTLQAMRAGGLFDQLGGGFHRYSTDERWLVPHFEKMLYDNAFLARAYAQAYQVTGKEEYARTVRETLDYVLRDMTSKDGAFYSAEDADVDHVEGAFYIWQPAQIRAVVGDADADRVCRALGVTQEGNFESPHPEDPKGMSVLHRVEPLDDATRAKLLEARSKRKRPHLDDKILADWNGLMIGAMGFAGFVLNEPRYLAAAERAAGFALRNLRTSDGRWMHTSTIPGFLDDYALLAEGFFLLYQATFKVEYLEIAKRTAELMIEDFADPAGGFFQTSKNAEKLIIRAKEAYDGALPSGNSVATLVLLRLGFRKEAEAALQYFAGTIARAPVAYPYHLCALEALATGSQEVKLEGEVGPFVDLIRQIYLPNSTVEVKRGGETRAMVCTNGTCALPVTTAAELKKQLAPQGP